MPDLGPGIKAQSCQYNGISKGDVNLHLADGANAVFGRAFRSSNHCDKPRGLESVT